MSASFPKQDELLERLKELEWFEKCLTVTTESPDILSMMMGIRDLLAEYFSFDRVGIMVGSLDPRYCIIHEFVTRQDMEPCPPGSLMIIQNTGLEWVFTHNQTHYSADIKTHPEFLEDEELASVGLRSIIRVPLTVNHQTYGVMTVKSVEPNHYNEEQIALITRLARRLSAGVHALKLIQDLRELSLHDPLTKAYNRYFLNQLLDSPMPLQYIRETTHMDFEDTDVVSVLFLDICDFKSYNDAYGHLQGDECLRDLASSAMKAVAEGIVARFGGDEFVIIVPGIKGQNVLALESKLRQAFPLRDAHRIELDVSIGSATGQFGNLEEIIDIADQCMYRDKSIQKSTP